MNRKHLKRFTALAVLVAVAIAISIPALARDKPEFKAKALIAISDGDMVASAYAGGNLGPKVSEDALSAIDLRNGIERVSVKTVPVFNSVPGAPCALALSPDGRTAFVSESRKPRSRNAATIRDLEQGRTVTAVDISNLSNPKVISTVTFDRRPNSVSVSPDCKWLAVGMDRGEGVTGQQLALIAFEGRNLGDPVYLSLPGMSDRVYPKMTIFHPQQMVLASLMSSENEVRFFKIRMENQPPVLEVWGNPVSTGKYPNSGRFTPDGRHLLFAELQWGRDVPDSAGEAPVGQVAMIRLAEGDRDLHSRVAAVEGSVSPEGLEISPDGKYAISTSIEYSWLASDDPRYSPYSVLSLIEIDNQRSRLIKHDDVLFYGQLPEGAAFDTTGTNLFITSFADPSDDRTPGFLQHYRIVETRRGKKLAPTDIQIDVPRGVHLVMPIYN